MQPAAETFSVDPKNPANRVLHYDPMANFKQIGDNVLPKIKPIEIVFDANNFIVGMKNSKLYTNFYRSNKPGKKLIRFEKYVKDEKKWHIIIFDERNGLEESKSRRILFYNTEMPFKIGNDSYEYPFVFRLDADYNITYEQSDQHIGAECILYPQNFKDALEEVRMESPEYARGKAEYNQALVLHKTRKANAAQKVIDNIGHAIHEPINIHLALVDSGRHTALKLKNKLFIREKARVKNSVYSSEFQVIAAPLIESCNNDEEYAHAQTANMILQLENYNVMDSIRAVKPKKDYLNNFLSEIRASFALFAVLKKKYNLYL